MADMQPDIPVPDEPDDVRYCPECGGRMVNDWEGDPNVINGTRDLLTCRDCGVSIVDEDSPLGVTEKLFEWAKKNGHMPQ